MPMSGVIQHLRGKVLTDAELLADYVSRRDDGAFAALVRRHGPMVWSVCRRLLSHHDAEDAFQATFLVLVRKAAGDPLAGACPEDASGTQSVVWRRRWEATRDDQWKQTLVRYNLEDCAALMRVTDGL